MPAGASFCASCGRPAAVAPPATGGKDTRTAENLILAGALFGAAILILGGIVLLFIGLIVGAAFAPLAEGDGPLWLFAFPFSFLGAVMSVFAIFGLFVLVLGIGWTWAALRARKLLRRGDVEAGSVWAIVVGAIMVVLGISAFLPAIAGGLVLAGGLLARAR